MPGISFPLALCAEYPRGNFEEDSGERKEERNRERERERILDDEEDFARASEGGREDAEGPARLGEVERWRLAPGGFFVRQ